MAEKKIKIVYKKREEQRREARNFALNFGNYNKAIIKGLERDKDTRAYFLLSSYITIIVSSIFFILSLRNDPNSIEYSAVILLSVAIVMALLHIWSVYYWRKKDEEIKGHKKVNEIMNNIQAENQPQYYLK